MPPAQRKKNQEDTLCFLQSFLLSLWARNSHISPTSLQVKLGNAEKHLDTWRDQLSLLQESTYLNYLSLHNNYHISRGLKKHPFIISLAVGQKSRHWILCFRVFKRLQSKCLVRLESHLRLEQGRIYFQAFRVTGSIQFLMLLD